MRPALVLCALLALAAPAFARAPATRPAYFDRIYDNVTIGGGGADDAKRRVNNDTLERGGWKAMIPALAEVADAGCWNFVIANPGGFNRTGWYEMGQMVHARDGVKGESPKLPWLAKDFDVAMSGFIRDQAKLGRRIVIIPYIGAGAADVELDPTKTTLADRTYYRYDALNKLLRGCNALGLDAATLISEDSEQGRFIQSLGATIPLFLEGYPSKANAWTARYNVYCEQSSLARRFDGNGQYTAAEGGWGVPEKEIKGKIVVIYDEGTEAGVVPFARRQLAAGRCVSVPMYVLINGKIPLTALDPAN